MSANNQILVKKHEGKWYVFDNVQAESWSDNNELSIKSSVVVLNSKIEALEKAFEIQKNMEWPDEAEYGAQVDTLAKDNADVTLI